MKDRVRLSFVTADTEQAVEAKAELVRLHGEHSP